MLLLLPGPLGQRLLFLAVLGLHLLLLLHRLTPPAAPLTPESRAALSRGLAHAPSTRPPARSAARSSFCQSRFVPAQATLGLLAQALCLRHGVASRFSVQWDCA